MIKYIKNLYLTSDTQKDVDSIINKLNAGIDMFGLQVIMLAANDKDCFDIVPARMFKSKRFCELDHVVIGFAESKNKAYGLVEEIVMKHFQLTGHYTDLRKDFEKMMIEE